jgi:FlaG/FlaF family flagellin (archaellin)
MYIRSISPTIASILIIVITVAIAGIFYAFTSGMFGSLTSSSNNLVNQQSQIISFQILDTYCSNNTLYLIIYNNGNIPIDVNNTTTIISNNQQDTYNTTIICNNTTIIQPRQQITCNLDNIVCYYDPLSNSKYEVSLIVDGEKAEKYLGTGYEATPLLPGYSYLRDVIIDNSLNSNSLTDYQISITLDTQSLISQGKMKTDCSDIRFTDFDGTLLNYWIEPNTCNTNNTKIWVKVPFIPGGSTKTIYLWYGNPNATSMSNVNSVFIDIINGLVAAWNFNEGEGNIVYDSSGNGNNGIVYGAAWVNGIYGKALSFDGIDDYVKTSMANGIGNKTISECLWVKFNSFATENQFGYIKGSVGWGRYFYFSSWCSSGAPHNCIHLGTINTDGSWGRAITTGPVFEVDKWYHICGVIDTVNGFIKVYINGTLFYSASIPTGDIPGTPLEIWVGGSPEQYQWANGIIDEVMFFNKALSPEEILNLYNNYGYSTPNYPGKVLIKKYTSPEPTIFLGNEVNIQ